MRRWSIAAESGPKKARIEIIPMIDTIFFLLVYFMFVSLSTVHMKGMGVNLPHSADSLASAPVPRIVVRVDSAGSYFINKVVVPESSLTSLLQQRINVQPKSIIVVDVDKHKSTQTLIGVMDSVNQVTLPGSDDSPPLAIASNGTDQPVN
jgi:biopolymer transport protein ExbD